MSPDAADDGSASPEPELSDQDQEESGIMAEDNMARAVSDEKSPAARAGAGTGTGNGQTAKSNAKDPSRPRRKKARRACFACQRAHLTCGDERPCLRCIKRGLHDQCHDGVRKKAKYLHDAPPEALIPGFNYHQDANGSNQMPSLVGASSAGSNGMAISQTGDFFPQVSGGNYQQFSAVAQPGQMGPPQMDNSIVTDFNTQQGPETPSQYQSTSSQQVSPNQNLTTPIDQSVSFGATTDSNFTAPFFDPNDPSFFNFDVSGLNFGNHYGALEFGMLGHMSSGAVGTPDVDTGIMNPMRSGSMSYDASATGNFQTSGSGYNFNQGFPSWQSIPSAGSRQSSTSTWYNTNNTGLDAYAIGEVSASLAGTSPNSAGPQDFSTGYQSQTSQTMSPETQFLHADQQQQQQQQQDLRQQSFRQHSRHRLPASSELDGQNSARKRRRDTSQIYNAVQAPYSYTTGFHALTAFLQKRFPSTKTLKIAKALASIRPSFISCNKDLNHEDLIFMEKCFQRTLWEYENFINAYGTPTIICRRTGEVAAVSKEFSLVTGWRRDVLLGNEPNLNVNTGGNNSGTHTGTSSRGAATPRLPNAEVDPGRPQSVFLAELLDEDSVVQFYQDFADLAFSSSGTNVIGAQCSLLKYRTKDDPGWGPDDHLASSSNRRLHSSGSIPHTRPEPLIRGEASMNALGERYGRVDCSMCWTVKRDVFDIPMLIVMNFLPVI